MNAVVDWQLPGTTSDREVWMARHGPPDGLDRFLRHGPAEIDRSGNEHVPRILGRWPLRTALVRPCLFWMPAMSTLGLGAVGGGDWRASSQVDDNVTSAGRSAGGWRALEISQLDGIHRFIKSKQTSVVRGHLRPGNHNALWLHYPVSGGLPILGRWGSRQTILVPRVGVALITRGDMAGVSLNARQGEMMEMSRWFGLRLVRGDSRWVNIVR